MAKGSVTGEVVTRADGTIVYKAGRPIVKVRPNRGRELDRNAQGIAGAALAARAEAGGRLERGVAVSVTLRFYVPRPQGHYGSGRNAGLLRDSAPLRPFVRPDVDKQARQVLDAITGVLYADDGQVVELAASKHYAEGDDPPRIEAELRVLAPQTVGAQVSASQLALAP